MICFLFAVTAAGSAQKASADFKMAGDVETGSGRARADSVQSDDGLTMSLLDDVSTPKPSNKTRPTRRRERPERLSMDTDLRENLCCLCILLILAFIGTMLGSGGFRSP